MPDEAPTTSANREHAVQIVAGYVRNNQIAADQIPALISSVYEAISGLGNPESEVGGDFTPAVPIRRSVTRDYVVCLDCGWRARMLRRHLTTAHGLTVDEYRARWRLSAEHPLTAPGYSERRSEMAKQLGLGRGGRPAGKPEPAAGKPAPTRRRRSNLPATGA